MHIIQASNVENQVLENKFCSVRNYTDILETQLRTEEQSIDSKVSGVES